ncbi:hypothetical protein A1O1_00997 [Capronia coronata CBS 617.96]|uniref:Uncharacterized protein n=1 Tax=Capronia coronata CBS 617.96 TaxID=1182541 RepID=W9YSM4_9EURO|nr:uncharacterized protein A1O1_00997 [Capronia coronata CBS 617.96]EXJ95872.1 hypothetical protein A1O1_00997 [Capronia coronata CBS 617.96]
MANPVQAQGTVYVPQYPNWGWELPSCRARPLEQGQGLPYLVKHISQSHNDFDFVLHLLEVASRFYLPPQLATQHMLLPPPRDLASIRLPLHRNWQRVFIMKELPAQTKQPLEQELAQYIDQKGRMARARMMKNSFGSGSRFRRPRVPMSAIELIDLASMVFKLHTDTHTNNIFMDAVTVNLAVLHELDAWCAEQWNLLSDQHSEICERQERSNDSGLAEERVTIAHEIRVLWRRREILFLEIGISETARKRLDTARHATELKGKLSSTLTESERQHNEEALKAWYGEWLVLRHAMLIAATKVHQQTGDKEFFKRHQYELWDLVDARLEY